MILSKSSNFTVKVKSRIILEHFLTYSSRGWKRKSWKIRVYSDDTSSGKVFCWLMSLSKWSLDITIPRCCILGGLKFFLQNITSAMEEILSFKRWLRQDWSHIVNFLVLIEYETLVPSLSRAEPGPHSLV
jgi:hypothetical protein